MVEKVEHAILDVRNEEHAMVEAREVEARDGRRTGERARDGRRMEGRASAIQHGIDISGENIMSNHINTKQEYHSNCNLHSF